MDDEDDVFMYGATIHVYATVRGQEGQAPARIVVPVIPGITNKRPRYAKTPSMASGLTLISSVPSNADSNIFSTSRFTCAGDCAK